MNTIVETINAAGRAFVDFSLPMLIQSSVLILILLAVDVVLRRRVRAVFRYWIWMLVLVKLVLPPSLGSPISVGTWFGDRLEVPTVSLVEPEPMPVPDLESQGQEPSPIVSDIIAPSDSMIAQPGVLPQASMPAPTEIPKTVVSLSWQGFVLLAWSVVVIALALLLVQRAFFVHGLVAQAEETNRAMLSELEDCRRRLGLHGRIGLRLSPNATSPAVCGLVHPTILIPQSLVPRLHNHDLQAVLLHELAHVKRGDLWINLAQTLLQIAYFYNPLLWLANAMIRRTREQAVDETVLVAMGETAKQYPEILVNIAKLVFTRRPALSLRLIGVVESKSALTARIKHILSRPVPKSAKLGLLGLLTIVVIAAVLLPMAAGRSTVGRPDGSGERQSVFVETLSNGAVVELLGVCEYPSPGRQWWRPDGSLMERAPYKTTGNERQQEAGFKDYELVVRYGGAPDMSIEWDVPGSRNSGITGSPLGEDDRRIWDLTVNTVRFPEDQASATVRVAAAGGPWETRAVHKTLDREGAYSLDAGKAVTFGIAHMQTNDMLVPVTVNLSRHDMAFRVVAVRGRDEICEGGLSGVGGDELNSLTYRFHCPLSDVKEFRFQTRPWTWVEFKDVSLRPGQKADAGSAARARARVVGIGPAWEALRDAVGTRYRGTIGGFGREERRSAEYLDKALSWTKAGDAFVLMLAFDESPVVPERYRDLLLLPWSEIENRVQRGESVEARGAARDLDVIVLATATSEQLNALVRKTPLLDAYRAEASKEIVLPEADKQPVILDLASGQLVAMPRVGPEPQKIQEVLRKRGKGDIVYDVDLGDRSLIFLRDAVSEQVQEDTGEPGVKGHLVGANLPEVLTVTTAEGRRYEVTILSADEEGCTLKYSLVALDKGAGGGALAEPTTADVKPSDSGLVARLANGVTITLLAYSQLGEKGLEWWTPQGERTTIPGVYEADVEGHGSVLALRIEPEPEYVLARYYQPPDVGRDLKIWRMDGSNTWLVALGQERNYVNVEVYARVKDPPAVHSVSVKQKDDQGVIQIGAYGSRITELKAIDSDTSRVGMSSMAGGPRVAAVLDTSDRVHPVRYVQTIPLPAGEQGTQELRRYEADVPLDDLAGIAIEGIAARGGSVKFRNILLTGGQPAQIRIEIAPEGAPMWFGSDLSSALTDLGDALSTYAGSHASWYPPDESTLHTLCSDQLWRCLQGHVVYLVAGKTSAVPAQTALAYVKTLLPFGFGTYVLYSYGNVKFEVPSKLKELGIPAGGTSGRVGGTLEFRVAAKWGNLDSAAIERYQLALVNSNNPPGADFAWFPSRVSTTGSSEVSVQEHGGATYVLLWNKLPHVILASQDWGLDKVYRTTDAMGKPAIGLTLNDKGAALVRDITAANVGRPLAILVDAQVVSMPHIMLPLDGRSALITGNFTEREVADMMAALRKGMEATQPPAKPGDTTDAGERPPAPVVDSGPQQIPMVTPAVDVTLTLGGDDPLGLFYNEHGLWFELDNRGSDSVEINPHPLDQDADRRGEWGYVEVLGEDGNTVTYKWRDSPPSVHKIPPGKRYKVQDFLNGMPLRESGPGVYKVRLTLRVRNVRTNEATFIPSNWHTFHVTPAGRWPDQVRGPYVELREAEAFASTCNYGHGSHDEAIRRLLALAEKYAGTKYSLEAYFTAADQANTASYEPGDLAAYQAKRREYHREIVKRWPDVVNHYTIYARLHTHFGMSESEFIQSRRETYRWLLSVTEEQKIASIRAYGAFTVQLSDEPTDEDVRRSLASLNQYISRTKQMLETSSPDIAAGASKSEAASEDDESTSDGISGRVVDPNGRPVAGAQVALCSKDQGAIIRAGQLAPTNRADKSSEIVQTDAQGRFSFASAPEEFHLIAAHDVGCAWVTSEELRAAADLRLAPWARIEGTLKIGQTPGADERVELFNYINKNAIDQNVRFDYQSQTDAAGRFAFTKVPPTWVEVGYLIRTGESTSTYTCRTPIHLQAGQTMRMALGGQGRPVVGRFVPPADYQGPIYFGAGLRAFSTSRPERPQPDSYDQMTKRQQAEWLKQWLKTPEARAYYDAMWHDLNRRHYAFRIQDDGSFRIEDVTPGNYEFTVWLEEQFTGQGRQEEIGGYYGTAQVPAMMQTYTEEPLNLGELTLSMRNPPLHVGDTAPLFEARTLDGKDIRLADYRGRFVLLAFWSPVFHPELARLKELHATYGGTGRLQIIGLGGTDTLGEVGKYAEEQQIEWPEVYFGPDWDAELLKQLGGQMQIMLIDPEGRIVATWLREEKLTNTVRDAITAADPAKSVSTSPGPAEGRRRR